MSFDLSFTAEQINSKLKAPAASGRRVACIGTSLVQQQHHGASNYIKTGQRGWLPWAIAYTKGVAVHPVWYDPTVVPGWEPSGVGGTTRYFQGLNFGVSGQTIAEIVARIPYIVANYINKFDVIIVDAGTNDMTNQTKEYIQRQREYIVNTFLAYGKKVILLPILNRAVSSWAVGPYRRKCNWINKRTREFVDRTAGVYLSDWNAPWVDFTNVNGEPKFTHCGDGIHFDVEGAEAYGEQLATLLLEILPPAAPTVWAADNIYDATDNPKGSLLGINPLLLGATAGTNGTGSSGTVISGAQIERNTGSSCTVANSIAARADGKGNNQVLTFTMAGTTDEKFYFRTTPANTVHGNPDKFFVGRAEIETNASDMIYGISLFVEDQYGVKMATEAFDGHAWAEAASWPGKGGVLSKWATKARNFLLETPAFKVDALSTDIRWRIEIIVRGGGSVAPIIKIGGVELCIVDDPSISLPTL